MQILQCVRGRRSLWCLCNPNRKRKWSLLIFNPDRMSSIIHSSLWAWERSWCDNTWRKWQHLESCSRVRSSAGVQEVELTYLQPPEVTDVLKVWTNHWQLTLHPLILAPHPLHFLQRLNKPIVVTLTYNELISAPCGVLRSKMKQTLFHKEAGC